MHFPSESNLAISKIDPIDCIDDVSGFERLASENVLAPGYFWRLKNNLEVKSPHGRGYTNELFAGDVHLLLDIFEFEGAPHTVTVLCHPRNGSSTEYKILIADFLANFEPEKDADSVRTREQAAIMQEVSDIQEEMTRAHIDPLALPGLQEAAQQAVDDLEKRMFAEAQTNSETQKQKEVDLRRIHRRATRRSDAAGNPLVARSMTISDQVGLMISGGINSDGLSDLTTEARRRVVVAESTSKWLAKRAEKLSDKLKSLAPFYGEKGRVALALASKAINHVKSINEGLQSLKLYTGDGVDVVTITEGPQALSSHPLMLVQGKRYMDEELAVWADVDDSFDWKDQSTFFATLKSNQSLVDQVFPSDRCVVSFAVTNRRVEYSKDTTVYERVMNDLRNRCVFLLVRNGENIHVVYSAEPSHESSARLFPTQSEIEHPFQGIDGSKIGLNDVSFSKSTAQFDNTALHYKRFLILLCGLDHRLKLMGDFYPQEGSLQFMSMEFQQKYFNFLEDDNPANLIGNHLEPVDVWMERCNKSVRSGSRVVIVTSSKMRASSPQMKRVSSLEIHAPGHSSQFSVVREKGNHCISVPVISRYHHSDIAQATFWLDGPNASDRQDWYLCMDLVRLQTVRRYIYSRISRSSSISWIRTFKGAESLLQAEHKQQMALRIELRKSVLDNQILQEHEVDEAIEVALSTWRAAHRGADAPDVSDTKAVHELLSLMYPADRIANSADHLLTQLIDGMGGKPLMLNRTGKNRLVLYVEASAADKETVAEGTQWGWVKRVLIDVKKTKLSVASTSLVWLQKDKPNVAETLIRVWPELDAWIQEHPEPCQVKWLTDMKASIASSASLLGEMLARGRAAPVQSGILDEALMRGLVWDAQNLTLSLNQNEAIYTKIPLGVSQAAAGEPVLFLYAVMNLANFVARYGNQEQSDHYKHAVLMDSPRLIRLALSSEEKWALVQTTEPIKKDAFLLKQLSRENTNWTRIESHNSGGVKKSDIKFRFHTTKTTRAQRRADGGHPLHDRASHPLSMSRAIEAFLGLAPHLRRKFYKEHRSSFYMTPEERKNGGARFSVKTPFHYLSPLIWNPEQGRSNANRYFSIRPAAK